MSVVNKSCPDQSSWREFLQGDDSKLSVEMEIHQDRCQACQQVLLELEDELRPLQVLLRHGVQQQDFSAEQEFKQAEENLIQFPQRDA